MSDNTSQAGTDVIRTDERTIGGSTVKVQEVAGIGSTAFAYGQVGPTASATLISAARDTRHRLTIQNIHASIDCWVGDGSVTTSTGFKLPYGGSSLTLLVIGAVYAITAGSTGSVCYIEEYDS